MYRSPSIVLHCFAHFFSAYSDYYLPQVLVIPPFSTYQCYNISIAGDEIVEDDENILVYLHPAYNPQQQVIGVSVINSLYVVIFDDDGKYTDLSVSFMTVCFNHHLQERTSHFKTQLFMLWNKMKISVLMLVLS